MELKMLLLLARRWAWLLILGLILGAVGGYVASRYQTPIFQASTQVLVMRAPESSVSNVSDLSDQELIQTYIELLETKPVLEETSRLLGFNVSAGQISARQVGGTKLLRVVVQDTQPDRAALIANQIVDVLIAQNETLQASLYSSSEESLQAQIAQIEAQVSSLQSDITERSQANIESEQQQLEAERQELEALIFTLQSEIADLEVEIEALAPRSAGPGEPVPTLSALQQTKISDMRTELAQKQFSLDLAQQRYFSLVLPENDNIKTSEEARQSQQQATLALYQQIYSTLLSNYEAVRLARLQNTANVIQVEPATPPNRPVPPRPLTLMGAVAGLVAASGLAFIIEYLDVSLKTPDDIAQVLGLPVIGYLGTIPVGKGAKNKPHVLENPRSPIAESLRNLRANLEFANAEKPLKTILVTSPGQGQGKTTVLSNLAIVMAQAGRRVILIDADLRRPAQHATFGLSNKRGLTSLLLESSVLDEDESFMHILDDTVQETRVEGLSVLTCGPIPPNPSELLGSPRMAHLLKHVEEAADIVFVDSPPLLVADASVLAAKLDGVIILIEPGETPAATAELMIDQLNRAGARVVGVVLNRITGKAAGYYNAYKRYYGSAYYDEEEQEEGQENGRFPNRSLRNRLTDLSSRVR